MTNEEIVAALRSLADAIEQNDSSRVSRSVARIPRVAGARRASGRIEKNRRRKTIAKIDHSKLARVAEQLADFDSRESGLKLLEKEDFARNELVTLAKRLSVHVTKLDKIERIEEKIVETVIGSKLSSIAIRGN